MWSMQRVDPSKSRKAVNLFNRNVVSCNEARFHDDVFSGYKVEKDVI
jgi:hypothetical protein